MAEIPQKDVVYIDVEDDITAIIGKLKSSKHSIVALVPPKRTSVLQSAVNLRLLARSAEQHNKRLVLITGNHALVGLAAAAKIPVAKNLQSKPELGEIAALDIDNGEEIIDGAQLPIGEHAKQAAMGDDEVAAAAALGATALGQADDTPVVRGAKKKNPKIKVPNFSSFRKKLFLAGVVGASLIGFLVWAIWFAPHATVVLTMRTTRANVSQQAALSTGAETSAANGTLAATVKKSTESVTIPFDATGKKNVGDKATGTVQLSQQSLSPRSVAAGTTLTTVSGMEFITDSAVTIPASSLGFPNCFPTACPGTVTVTVTAAESGESHNGENGNLSGAGDGISTTFTEASSGGTDKEVPTVTKEDLDTAKSKIEDEIDKDSAKQALSEEFGDGYVVVAESFTINTSNVSGSVKVGSEAPSGQATLKGNVEYTLYAVSKDELNTYLDEIITQQIDNPEEQRIYSNGVDTAEFGDVQKAENGIIVSLVANGSIGPKIEESQVRDIAAGKNYGEIQEALVAITGIDGADTEFSPFWVSRAPNDTAKISVEFQLNEQ